MALKRQIARLAKILVDSEGISFDQAQAKLEGLTLEVVVGKDAVSPAAHAAALTAVSVGRRSFVGGVKIVGEIDQPLNSTLPLSADTLGGAAAEIGASQFAGPASRTIHIGDEGSARSIGTWWNGWQAGTQFGAERSGTGDNPLSGIAAGGLAVGAAFEAARGRDVDHKFRLNLWAADASDRTAPSFAEVFLPGALWMIGMGNLGQAYLWALASLPYAAPDSVSLVLQDHDRITEENWATSVLVREETYGALKTKVSEQWADAKGFDVRRVDRRLGAGDRLDDNDPRVALSGVDKIAARKLMAGTGFDCIVDAGLGRTANDFDRYRVSVFDRARTIDGHFAAVGDEKEATSLPTEEAYRRLEEEIGRCGAAEILGASVAVPYVSAVASAVAVSRLIAVASGCECPTSEVGRISASTRRVSPIARIQARGMRHAGRPSIILRRSNGA
ncbi:MULTISPECIES: hypothetical protein [unclassified Bradyrhizobium]|uniref:hypothetical protein n=1 Tax=unclassified Bradyrhizobium TaxID=2631580 RepID=UPI0028E23C38|nr:MULTISPECIES: hypothetical protein [unclassified Bradyrhizobium]